MAAVKCLLILLISRSKSSWCPSRNEIVFFGSKAALSPTPIGAGSRFRKVKEDVPMSSGLTTPLKYSGTGIKPLKYFEDLPASGGLKSESDPEIAENSHLYMNIS
jgi:hypothetical protein